MAEEAEGKPEMVDKEEMTPSGDQDDGDTGEAGKSSKLDKLLHRLQGQGSAEHSRESSPEPSSKDGGQAGRQSRRKPKVTRKVIDDEDEGNGDAASSAAEATDVDMVDAAMDLAIEEFLNSSEKDPTEEEKPKNGQADIEKGTENKDKKKKDSLDVDKDGNVILPAGTVVVQPEAVTDNKPVFKGPEFRSSTTSSRKSNVQVGDVDLNMVHCSACNHQINTNHANSVKRHPVLKVLICKRCYNWYASDEIIQDQDGMDEQCRWCGEGGDLLCCDFCHNAFCKGCIRRNLGRGELSNLLEADDNAKWHCYVCDPKPLASLIYNCDLVMEAIVKREEKKKEREKKTEEKKKKPPMPAQNIKNLPGKPITGDKHVMQAKAGVGKVQQKTNTVYNLLGGNQPYGTQNLKGGPVKGVPVVPKQGQVSGQMQGKNVFVEWMFKVNETNVMPIIDRAMMVTESMHMLLTSLREDIQKVSTGNTSQRTVTKQDAANKLKRALGAFNKSFFDLSLFSQKTSGPGTVRQVMEDQQKGKQQQIRQQPQQRMQVQQQRGMPSGQKSVHPVRLVQHGQQVVMVPSGNPVAKNPKQQQKLAPKLPVKAKPDSGKVEYIELLDDSDDESKAKNSSKKNSEKKSDVKDDDEKDEKTKKSGFQLKVALGGKGHKLKGPLSRKRKLEEEEQREKEEQEAKAREAKQKEEKEKPSSEDAETGKEIAEASKEDESREVAQDMDNSHDEANDENEAKSDDEEKPVEKESVGIAAETHDDDHSCNNDIGQADINDDVDENVQEAESVHRKEDEDEVMEVDLDKEQEPQVDDDSHADDSRANEDDETEEVKEAAGDEMEDENIAGDSGEQDGDSGDLDQFKTIEEQLKQLNGGYTDDSFSKSDDRMDFDLSKTTDGSSFDGGEKIVQLDGPNDNYDTSSDEESPAKPASTSNGVDIGSSPKVKTYDDLFSASQLEPLFNLDTLSNSGSNVEGSDENSTDCPMYDLGNGDAPDGYVEDNDGPEADDANDSGKNEIMEDGEADRGNETLENGEAELSNAEANVVKLNNDGAGDASDSVSQDEVSRSVSPEPVRKISKGKKDKKSPVKRSRADIEAQRMLHKELLDIDSADEESADEVAEDDDDDDDSVEEKIPDKKKGRKTYSDDEEYKPATDRKQLQDDRKLGGVRYRGKRGKGKAKAKKDLRCIIKTKKEDSSDFEVSSSESQSDDELESGKHSKQTSEGAGSSSDEDTKKKASKHSKKQKKSKDNASDSDGSKASQKPSQLKGKKSHDAEESAKSGSENFDSDLEKDIENLAKMPKLNDKKQRKTDNTEEKMKNVSEKKKSGKREEASNGSSKKKTVQDMVAELSSGEEEDQPVEEEEEKNEVAEDSDESEKNRKIAADKSKEDKDSRARRALLAIESSDDSEDSDMDTDEKTADVKKKSSSKKSSKSKGVDEEDYESDDILPTNKRSRHALLDVKISDSDESEKTSKKKKKKDTGISTDSDVAPKKKGKRGKRKKASSSEASTDTESESEKKKSKKKRRKRVKMGSDSSDANKSADSDDASGTPGNKRKQIRKIMKDQKLSETTISAVKAEEDRRARVAERQKKYNQVTIDDDHSPTKCPITTKLVLESDKESKKPIIEVNPNLIKKLKPHQVEAVKFMWDCCAETIKRLQKEDGGGCILAHCMGLGKTLSVISFLSTIMAHPKKTKIRTALVVCPLNTVLNWQAEFAKWLDDEDAFDVWEMSSIKDNYGRSDALQDWQESGGIMIIGYEMFRNLTMHRNIKQKKIKKIMTDTLVDPGPDIVICDEGHMLKNDASALSKAMSQIKTRRRVVLTGTPLQNNLVEYHCMVNFVKPNLLGSRKEFTNRFVNPITNGQCSDSTAHDVRVMKRRAHILHDILAGCVQRKDYSALTKFLMPKYEYVIQVRLSTLQMDLYEKYLERNLQGLMVNGRITNKGASLFKDYQYLMKIWTHPWALKLDEIRQENKKLFDDDSEFDSFIDDDSETDAKSTSSSSAGDDDQNSEREEIVTSRGRTTRATRRNQKDQSPSSSRGSTNGRQEDDEEVVSREWWGEYMSLEDKYKCELGGKIMVLSEILKMCESIGDKVLVFSQSLLSLDLIEDFLEYWDSSSKADPENQLSGPVSWVPGLDYHRMDGSTTAAKRKSTTNNFNDPDNTRMRLFLISTKAGSLGINLVSANRVIVFDASWNPTHDIQSIFRVYRFGQEKPVYVYRFLAQGTMEEKIYERQVTKQSLSQRVVDEHQIERHFSSADLQELYNFKPDRLDDPEKSEKPVPKLPKDRLLAELLTNQSDWLVGYHEHDSLLQNIEGETLTEEERKAAWEEYEAEKQGLLKRTTPVIANMYQMYNMQQQQQQQYAAATGGHSDLQNIVPEAEQIARAIFAANPGISQEMLQQKVHAYLQQRMEQQRMLMMQRQHEQQMQAELMKLHQLRLQRYRQQQYLSQMQSAGASNQSLGESSTNQYSQLMQQLAGTSNSTGQAQSEDKEEGEVSVAPGLLDLLRKGIS